MDSILQPGSEQSSKVYSTGQTMEDFVQLAKLASYLPERMLTSKDNATIHPVLLDPNYIPPNRGPLIMAINTASCSLAVAAVFLKVYYATYRSRYQRLLLEDYLMVIATVFMVGMTIINCYGAAELQWGMIMADLRMRSLEATSVIIYSYHYMAVFCMTMIRISIVLFFRRIYARIGSRTIWFCNTVITLSAGYSIFSIFLATFACRPVSAGWSIWERMKTRGCGAHDLYLASGVMQVVLDMAVIAVPLRLVLSLTISSWKTKMQIFVLLAVGSLSWVAALVRLLYVRDGSIFVWDTLITSIIWRQLEITIAIVCACMPMIKSLLSQTSKHEYDSDLSDRIIRSVRQKPRGRPNHLTTTTAQHNVVERGVLHGALIGGVISVRAMKGLTPSATPTPLSPMSDRQCLRKPEPAVIVSGVGDEEEYEYYDEHPDNMIGLAMSRSISRTSTVDYDDLHAYRGLEENARSSIARSSMLAPARSRATSFGSSYGRSSRESTYSNLGDDSPMAGLGYRSNSTVNTNALRQLSI